MRQKIQIIPALIFISLLLSGAVIQAGQSSEDPAVKLERAIQVETVDGDLQAAIKLYQEIIAKYGGNRSIAAKAQLHIGFCYEKLGKSEAIKAYELVVTNYADQTELVSAARSRLTSLKAKKPDMVTVTQFPTLSGGKLSPDGTRVVGVSYGGGQNIAVLNVGEDKVTLITRFDWSNEGGWTSNPVWSPDGTQIAFMFGGILNDKPVELRTTTLDGKQRTLYTCVNGETIFPIQWLPPGDSILCGRSQSDGSTLGIVSIRDGHFRPLRQVSRGTIACASPDGKHIVFHEGEDESRNLYVLSTDGKSYKPLTEGPTDDKRPLWSPDGRHIVFLSHRYGGWALWGIEVDADGKPKGLPFFIREGMQNANLKNWTSSGLYYHMNIDTSDVFVMSVDPETGRLIGKPRQVDFSPTGNNKRPVWSPDGKYLAFVSHSEDYPSQGYVVIMPAAGGDAKKFPFPTRDYLAPVFHDMRWRPDGKAIGIHWRKNDIVKSSFFVLDPATGKWQTWTLPRDYEIRMRAEWKGDGKAIYLAQYLAQNVKPNKDRGIIEYDLESGQERYIYRTGDSRGHFTDLTCSRDYSKLAIMDGRRNLVIVDVKTGKTLREFTREAGWRHASVAWSPNGDLLFVPHQPPRSLKIKKYSVLSMEDGSEKTYEFNESFPGQPSYFDWSPDGTRMAFSTRIQRREGFLLSNIIPDKKQQ